MFPVSTSVVLLFYVWRWMICSLINVCLYNVVKERSSAQQKLKSHLNNSIRRASILSASHQWTMNIEKIVGEKVVVEQAKRRSEDQIKMSFVFYGRIGSCTKDEDVTSCWPIEVTEHGIMIVRSSNISHAFLSVRVLQSIWMIIDLLSVSMLSDKSSTPTNVRRNSFWPRLMVYASAWK